MTIRNALLVILLLSLESTFSEFINAQMRNDSTTVYKGDEIVITASRTSRFLRDISSSMNLFTEQEIQKSGAKTIDELISHAPGVDIQRPGGYGATLHGVSIRGAGGTGTGTWGVRTLLLVDGVPMNDTYGMLRMNDIPMENVKRVEIIRGASSAMYGSNAMGGVIQVFTKETTKRFSTTGMIKYGNLNTKESNLNTGGNWGQFGYYLTGGFLKSDGFISTPPKDRNQYSFPDAQDNKYGNAKITWNIRNNSKLRFDTKHYDELIDKTVTSADRDVDDFNMSFNTKGTTISELSMLVFYHTDNYVTTYKNKSSAYKDIDHISSTPTDIGGFSVQGSTVQHKSHLVTVGTDLKQGKSHNTDLNSKNSLLAESAGIQRYLAFFIQDEMELHPRLLLTAGLRYDNVFSHSGYSYSPKAPNLRYEHETKASYSPKAGSIFKITDKSNFRVNVGKAFRSPSLFDLYRTWQSSTTLYKSNPLLKPETMLSYEASFDYLFSHEFYSKATFYDNEADNYIYYKDEAKGIKIRDNIAKMRMRGIELEFEKGMIHYLSTSFNYTFQKTENLKNEGDSKLIGKELTYTPQHKFNVCLNFNHPQYFTFNITGKYIGRQYSNDLNTVRLSDFFIITMNISRHISRYVSIALDIENLENKEYIIYSGNLGAPRLSTLSVRFHY